jgi:hypothetical protein
LFQAKQEEHVASLDIVDLRDCFRTVVLKWRKIFTTVMNFCYNARKLIKMDQRLKRNSLLFMVITKLFETIFQGLNTARIAGKCLPKIRLH